MSKETSRSKTISISELQKGAKQLSATEITESKAESKGANQKELENLGLFLLFNFSSD
jgi:hypothetical protein